MGQTQWTRSQVDATKERVRIALDEIRNEHPPEEVYQYLLEQIAEVIRDSDHTSQITAFVQIVSLLNYNNAYHILSDAKVEHYGEVARGILETHGVKPGTSKLAFLYGELQLVRSLYFRSQGRFFLSAFEQRKSLIYSGLRPPGEMGHHLLSAGLRAMRLGLGDRARSYFLKAQEESLPEESRSLLYIQHAVLSRLRGEVDQAASCLDRWKKEIGRSDRLDQLEYKWERICLEVMASGDPRKFFSVIRSKRSHFRQTYILEAFLWAAASKPSLIDMFPIKIANLGRYRGLRVRNSDIFLKLAKSLNFGFHGQGTKWQKIEELSKVMPAVASLGSIDKELLALATISRFLAHHRIYELAELFIDEYRHLSRKLSGGNSEDSLALLGDLYTCPWYLGRAQSSSN